MSGWKPVYLTDRGDKILPQKTPQKTFGNFAKCLYNRYMKTKPCATVTILKALAHPTRLWIVQKLGVKEHCVCEFVHQTEFDFSTVSKHLKLMSACGVLKTRREGKHIFYRLASPCLLTFLKCLTPNGCKTKAHKKDDACGCGCQDK